MSEMIGFLRFNALIALLVAISIGAKTGDWLAIPFACFSVVAVELLRAAYRKEKSLPI